MYVKRSELKQLEERIAATRSLMSKNEQLRQRIDSLNKEKEAVKALVEELKIRGNQLSDEVVIVGNDILHHQMATLRLAEKLQKEKKSIKANVKIERKVVLRGKEMSKIERINRYVDAALKVVGTLSP